MEDFGYSKQQEETAFGAVVKRAFLIAASLFSVACFVYVTINAYYYVYNDKNNNVELIMAEANPIKVIEEEHVMSDEDGMQIDNSIYEDIFGNKKASKPKEIKVKQATPPALPPKPALEVKKEIEPIIVYNDKKKDEGKDLLTSKSKNENPLPAEKKEVKPLKKGIRVQIAAVASSESAQKYASNLEKSYSGLLSGVKPFIEKADLGKRGIFYRVQIGNFYNQIRAEEFCARYIQATKKSRADCIVVE